MTKQGDNSMGRFSVEVEIANYRDMVKAEAGHLAGRGPLHCTARPPQRLQCYR
jgi:hypothetical protein